MKQRDGFKEAAESQELNVKYQGTKRENEVWIGEPMPSTIFSLAPLTSEAPHRAGSLGKVLALLGSI